MPHQSCRLFPFNLIDRPQHCQLSMDENCCADHRLLTPAHYTLVRRLAFKNKNIAMKNFGIALLTGIVGYVILAALSYYLIGRLSSNGHDRGVEASMTSIFVYGPIGFVISFIIGYLWAKSTF